MTLSPSPSLSRSPPPPSPPPAHGDEGGGPSSPQQSPGPSQPPPKPPQVALTADGIHVSPLDDRAYQFLALPNGLEALLISDPETETASAALDVHVGFHADPEGLPGLAHFCEHMLFLGTDKYPDENSYGAFLTAHGGSSNAFTSARNTNFYFDVGAAFLEEAVDRFAQFFVAPRFTASATDRELSAVDSENKNYLQDDYWRINQLHRGLGNPRHPYHKFGVGNLETLRDGPEARAHDLRGALLDYYGTYYSANLMRLVVYGREDLGTLARWVRGCFTDVRNNGRAGPPDYSQHAPFTPAQLGRRLEVVPVKDLNIIGLTWLLPPLRGPRYTQQQTSVIAHLLGHEGPGSLLSLLKRRQWAQSISAGIEEEHAEFALFLVNIEATDAGMAHVDEIALAVFQYLALLAAPDQPLAPWIFAELEDLSLMHFLFQSKQAPIHYTSGVAASMQTFARRDILTQDALYFPHDHAQIRELVAEHMTPARVKLLVVCKALEATADQEERWYGTRYRERALDPELIRQWTDCGVHEELALPAPNELIASDFTLLDPQRLLGAPSTYPRELRRDAHCRLWYKADVRFKKPRTHAALTFYSPHVNASPLAFVLSDLFVLCVQDELTEYAYDASLAGMHYDLAVQGHCVHLGAVGFSAKLDVLVRRIVETMREVAQGLPSETFARVHQHARRSYENMRYDEAFRLAMHATKTLMHEASWDTDELLTALGSVDEHLLRAHAQRVLDEFFLEAFVYGNVYEPEAEALVALVLECARGPRSRPVLGSWHGRWIPRQLRLPEGVDCVARRPHPNPDNLNCAIDCVYQIGVETPRERVTLAVFSQILSEPLFNQLRTQEQLGYTVFSTPSRQGGVQWFRVIVQSNVAPPEYLEQRLEAFYDDMRRFLADEMTDAQLHKHIQAIVLDYSEKPKSQEEEVQNFSVEIAIREYQFDRRERLAALVQTVQRADLVAFLDAHIRDVGPRRRRKKLSVRIYGRDFPPPVLLTPAAAAVDGHGAFDPDTRTCLGAAMALTGPTSASVGDRVIDDFNAFKSEMPLYGLPPARPSA